MCAARRLFNLIPRRDSQKHSCELETPSSLPISRSWKLKETSEYNSFLVDHSGRGLLGQGSILGEEKSNSEHVGKEDIFFRLHREEQRFLIRQYNEEQELWGQPLPRPEHQPTTAKRKKRTKKVWRKVERMPSSTSPRRDTRL